MRAPLSDDAVGPPLPHFFRYRSDTPEEVLCYYGRVWSVTELKRRSKTGPFADRVSSIPADALLQERSQPKCCVPTADAAGSQNRRGRVSVLFFFLFLVTHRNLESVVSGGASSACVVLAWPLHGASLQTRRFSFKGM